VPSLGLVLTGNSRLDCFNQESLGLAGNLTFKLSVDLSSYVRDTNFRTC
jgi:hypothetical protein